MTQRKQPKNKKQKLFIIGVLLVSSKALKGAYCSFSYLMLCLDCSWMLILNVIKVSNTEVSVCANNPSEQNIQAPG